MDMNLAYPLSSQVVKFNTVLLGHSKDADTYAEPETGGGGESRQTVPRSETDFKASVAPTMNILSKVVWQIWGWSFMLLFPFDIPEFFQRISSDGASK